jgi:putative phosphoribosyl transferase
MDAGWIPPQFQDRQEAGRILAEHLAADLHGEGLVIGLARGGVVVAAEVASTLGWPLDAVAVRKVGHPVQPEYAIGAVTPDGDTMLRDVTGLSDEQLEQAVDAARAQARELDGRLHAARPARSPAGRTCVLVDDGLATGATMVAAVRWARAAGAGSVAVAVPVGPPDTLDLLRREADATVSLLAPPDMMAVGAWYRDFQQVSDEQVLELLDIAAAAGPGA